MKNGMALLAGFFLLISTCGFAQKGTGKIIKRNYDLPAIDAVGLSLAGTVHLRQGSAQQVDIEADEELIDLISTEVKGGTWDIKFKDNKSRKNYKPIVVFLTVKDVRTLAIGGSGKILAENSFHLDHGLEVAIGGSGTVQFSGSAPKAEISIAGSGKIEAEDFVVDRCEVSVAGSGNTYIHVKDRLEVSVAGSGDVYYKGDPDVDKSIAGSGNVRRLE